MAATSAAFTGLPVRVTVFAQPAFITDSGTPALRNGLLVILSLVLIKGTPWGFNQIAARCTDYEVSSDITSDKPSTYKASFKTSGIVGSTTTVTG